MAPGGLVDLLAPVPSPHPFGLLDAATLVDPTGNRWLTGIWTGGYPVGPAHTHDPCATGTLRVKETNGPLGTQINERFVVYMDAFCTAQGVGVDAGWLTDRLELAFQTYEKIEVERALATGNDTLGHYLGDPNMDVLGGGVVTAHRALELLEDYISLNGTGIIHATPGVATDWASEFLIQSKGKQMYTALGTPVAVGAGYIGVTPSGQSGPASDQAWAFASGPIEIYRDPTIQVVPELYSQALDRSMNDLRYFAERPYAFNWIARQDGSDPDHTQAGVLVDLVP
jgi:hypothetical protein